ncbi:MAG: PAS domain S-box protein [Thermoanaerobaculia bacterium]|nr:PAS domain S-box protein [Thermoanaerobaculia bacterium]
MTEPIRILIVEDLATDLELVEGELRRGGLSYSSQHATSGVEFHAAIDVELPDIVLTDFNLPDIDGMGVVREIAARSDLIPVIIVTGSLDEETAANCIKGGATDYILKDRLFRLVPAVQAAMELRRLRLEEKRAQRELVRARDFYITLLDEFPNPVWRARPDAKCDYVNKAWLAFTGRTLDEELGEGWFDGVHPDDLATTVAAYFSAFERRMPYFAEYRLRRADGSYHRLASYGRPISGLDGTFLGYVGSAYDVQVRHDLQRKSEAHWRFLGTVLDHIDQIIYVFDDDDVIRYANETAVAARGIAPSELVGRSIRDFSTVTPEFLAEYGRAKSTREQLHCESMVLPTLSGQRRIYDFWLVPFVDPDGGRGVISAFTDVTARVDSEATRLLLMTAIEHAMEAVVITDAAGTIEYVNPAFEAATGYSPAEVVGRTPAILKSGYHDRAFYEALWSTITSGQAWVGTLVNRRKDGSTYREEASISPVPGPDGRTAHFVAVKRDLSREVELEQKLAHSQKLDAIGRLAGGIAHDFNNLLGVIGGYAELLSHSLGADHAGQERITQITRATERATALTRQLLAFGRKQVLQPRVVDLNQLLDDTSDLLRQLLREPIELEIVPSREPATVLVHQSQLEQVIFNLAVNARHAMPDGGRLRIETSIVEVEVDSSSVGDALEAGRWVRILVSDTGVGIPYEELVHIFEPFFTTRSEDGGTGLGLSTAYGIVRQSGGNIQVKSAPGRGTTFKIYLPAIDDRIETVASRGPAPPVRREITGTTVLVAEDVDLLREMICEGLEAAGMTVLEARDGEEALALSRSDGRRIDVLLTDVVMPKMSGRELGERMRAEREDLRILFMSGYTSDIIAATGVLEEGLNLLQKPFTIDTLVERIQILMGDLR